MFSDWPLGFMELSVLSIIIMTTKLKVATTFSSLVAVLSKLPTRVYCSVYAAGVVSKQPPRLNLQSLMLEGNWK